LMIKLEPSILISIVNGCKIQLIVSNPNLRHRGCVLYIYDKPNDPIFIAGESFGQEDPILKGLDLVLTTLVQHRQKIKLVLYNELNHPIFTIDIPIQTNRAAFEKWLYKIYNLDDFRYPTETASIHNHNPNDDQQGFTIALLNTDHSEVDKMLFLSPEYADAWRQNTSSNGSSFKLNDYEQNGKHGNLQELGITSTLGRFFEPGIDFFPSPQYINGLEFTDYIIIDNNAAIFIESKYVKSEKQTKKYQAIRKAVVQLNKAEDVILDGELSLLDTDIQKVLEKVTLVLKVCLINDRVELNDRNTAALTNEFDKTELPLFVSLTAFYNLLTMLGLKNLNILRKNLFANIIQMFNEYHTSSEKILYKNTFHVEGISIAELNEMGNKDDQNYASD